MQEISTQATEWGKQYLVLFQECMKDIGYAGKLLLSTEYGPQALYGAAGLFAAYYGVRGGVGLTYRCVANSPQGLCVMKTLFRVLRVVLKAILPRRGCFIPWQEW